jgi:hypothetical protein
MAIAPWNTFVGRDFRESGYLGMAIDYSKIARAKR